MLLFFTTTDYTSDFSIHFVQQQRLNEFTINYLYIQKCLPIFKMKGSKTPRLACSSVPHDKF